MKSGKCEMSGIENDIVQALVTYGPAAGKAAAPYVGTVAGRALQTLWDKIQEKFKSKGEAAESTINDLAAEPTNQDHQEDTARLLRRFLQGDPQFADEISQVWNEAKKDLTITQTTNNISGNSQVGIAGPNYGTVTIHQPRQETSPSPKYQLQIEMSYAYMEYPTSPYLDEIPHLCINALNTGDVPSYVSQVLFEITVEGATKVYSIYPGQNSAATYVSDKFGTPLPPGQSQSYLYAFSDLAALTKLGKNITLIAVHVRDQIGNNYRKPFQEEMKNKIMKYLYPNRRISKRNTPSQEQQP
jgi:hypothetical protein